MRENERVNSFHWLKKTRTDGTPQLCGIFMLVLEPDMTLLWRHTTYADKIEDKI